MIEFSGFLLVQARRARQETENVQYELDHNRREISDLKERENCIINDWRQEQNQTRHMEQELKRKEE